MTDSLAPTDDNVLLVSLCVCFASVAVLLYAPPSAQAQTTIADYREDFQTGSPATGWSYLWNQPDVYAEINFKSPGQKNSNGLEVDGIKIANPESDVDGSDDNPDNNYIPNKYDNDKTIGSEAHYTALEWFPGNKDIYTAVGQWPFDGRLQAAAGLYFASTKISPGLPANAGPTDEYNSEEGDGDPYENEIDRYAIAAYTVQPGEGGILEISDSTVELKEPGRSDGVEVRVYVDNSEIGEPKVITGSGTFDRDLGSVEAGETVYIAFGPNEGARADFFDLGYSLRRVE